MREFPARLTHQPIFYPVTNENYARQIASDWNTKDEASGFAGLVTRFVVDSDYLSRFEQHVVGAAEHAEYWIPAEELDSFNAAIEGVIGVGESYFGSNFVGWIPDSFGLKGKNAVQQFVCLAKTWDYSRMDFALEIWTNRKTVYLNSAFWAKHDFSSEGIDQQQKESVLKKLFHAWTELHHVEITLPVL